MTPITAPSVTTGELCVVEHEIGVREHKEGLVRQILALAETQLGLVSRRQAMALGMSRSMIQGWLESRRWRSVWPGVYALAGTFGTTRQRLMAAQLYFEGSVVSHLSAAAEWGFPGADPMQIDLSTTSNRSWRGTIVKLHRVSTLDECDLARRGPLLLTTAARTLMDIAGLVDEETLEQDLDYCVVTNLASLPRVRWTLQRLGKRGRPGSKALGRLLEARPKGYVPTHSVLEARVAKRVLRILEKEGLPSPVRQFVIKDKGRFVAQVDFAYPHAKVVIEAQSVKHHATAAAWKRDMKRFGDLAALGWRTLPLLWDDTRANVIAAVDRIRRAIEHPKLFL